MPKRPLYCLITGNFKPQAESPQVGWSPSSSCLCLRWRSNTRSSGGRFWSRPGFGGNILGGRFGGRNCPFWVRAWENVVPPQKLEEDKVPALTWSIQKRSKHRCIGLQRDKLNVLTIPFTNKGIKKQVLPILTKRTPMLCIILMRIVLCVFGTWQSFLQTWRWKSRRQLNLIKSHPVIFDCFVVLAHLEVDVSHIDLAL